MCALAGEQWPCSSDAGAVEGTPVLMFAIAVAVVAPPARSSGQIDFEQRVDHAHSVAKAGIVWRPQTEAHKGERVGTYDQRCRLAAILGWAVLDRHEPVERR